MDWRLILLFIALVKSQDLDNIDYGDPGDDDLGDACSMDYYDHEDSEICHHKHFPTKTLQDLFGTEAKLCCGTHGYIFEENCEVSSLPILSQYQLMINQLFYRVINT